MKKYTAAAIKGICNGIICSMIIAICVILLFYADFNDAVFCLIGLPAGTAAFLLMKQTKVKSFLLSWLLSILFFAATEIVISGLGIVNMFFYKINGDEIRMTAGDGFGIMVIHIINYFWIAVGTVTAFIVTVINQRNKRQI